MYSHSHAARHACGVLSVSQDAAIVLVPGRGMHVQKMEVSRQYEGPACITRRSQSTR